MHGEVHEEHCNISLSESNECRVQLYARIKKNMLSSLLKYTTDLGEYWKVLSHENEMQETVN